MKVVAIIQARMGSVRLPGKVMKEIQGVPMVELLIRRLSAARNIDQIVVATSSSGENQPLIEHVRSLGLVCFPGSESDVLQRYIDAAKHVSADVVVRITADCPLIDPDVVDEVIKVFREGNWEYVSNINPPTFPDGLDVEVLSLSTLEASAKQASDSYHREHVTAYVRDSGKFKTHNVSAGEDFSGLRWTVDEPEDLLVIENIFEHFSPGTDFFWKEVLELYKEKPELFRANSGIVRNGGASMGSGEKLWDRAKKVIPGGNMLLSKRPEMFLPGRWPSYFSKARGCMVWDLDGKRFIDMSLMGVGTNVLGYGRAEVDEAVMSAINAGNMSTLNCPEEVWLAERLVGMHPWADMARFARTGGEANAIAIRIARASSGKSNVAVCGYHGWHDWYLSANLGDDENLSGHLLPGLNPRGVPGNLRGSVFPFNYNDFDQLESIVREKDIGVIKMEVFRNMEPHDGFLHKVRDLADKHGIVLVFDECTSGFRETFGGLHKKYGVEPDMAIFGKALGNGYAITATIGRREVMEAAQSTFISSTFWTERIGPAAALKTLDIMEAEKSWETITESGKAIRVEWQRLADKYGLEIAHFGLPSLTGFSFVSDNAQEYKTLMTQEMLKKGYLASNVVYSCTEHTPDLVDEYLRNLDGVFSLVRDCEEGLPVENLLDGPVAHKGFKRLN